MFPLTSLPGTAVGWCLGAGADPHPNTVAAVSAACGALAEAGWTVTETAVPDLETAARDWATLINTDFQSLCGPQGTM